MKKYLFLISICFAMSGSAQVTSNCNVPQLLASEYHRDITQLATKRLFEIHSSDTALVRIPQIHYDSIAGGLAAVFNALSIPERDSIFNLYCVHNLNGWPIEYDGLLVQVDTNFAWTQAWQSLNNTTGNSYIDYITSTYSLTISQFFNWSFGNYALLLTDSSWNIPALIDTLEQEPGIVSAEADNIIGAAGTITYSSSGNFRYYNFFFEFSDCFDGCDNYHEWMFMVDYNCSVSYLGFQDYGIFGIQPLPQPVNCNTFTSTPDFSQGMNVIVYPNPVHDVLNIQLKGYELGQYILSVYDVLGNEVIHSTFDNDNIHLEAENLTGGIYFYSIHGKSGVLKGKFIKD